MEKDDNEAGSPAGPAREEQPPVFDAQRAMLNATPDCIKVLTPEGILLAMSEAGCIALGIAEDQVRGTSWIPLLPPATHAAARDALAVAATGETARFAGYSDGCGHTVHWDNLLTPAVDPAGRVHSIVCVSRDVTEQVLLQRKLDQLLASEQLLSGEMVHRIKNLFTVASAVMMMADREARACGTADQLAVIAASKFKALARVYDRVLAADDVSSVEICTFMDSVLYPFGAQCHFSGDRHLVPGQLANLLALFLHELATNSVKHGALSVPEGQVRINWSTQDERLAIEWQESDGPAIVAPPARRGYGTEMIDQLAGAARGTIKRTWHPHGLQVLLAIPLQHE
ncbi:sensor histidine kinase [Pseudomonas sp. L5B5]|uniref:sensor histidine kinase n=1 Tax=Pseudomonas sp. L5B5 TaxID=2883205 RepID=UPI001CFA2EB9|nr:PAS domain-containing protein [Pseudomonas sp. L5B5]UCZ84931.1 PAS domain-containing protein [Pseudomonas sp. L5B5]